MISWYPLEKLLLTTCFDDDIKNLMMETKKQIDVNYFRFFSALKLNSWIIYYLLLIIPQLMTSLRIWSNNDEHCYLFGQNHVVQVKCFWKFTKVLKIVKRVFSLQFVLMNYLLQRDSTLIIGLSSLYSWMIEWINCKEADLKKKTICTFQTRLLSDRPILVYYNKNWLIYVIINYN